MALLPPAPHVRLLIRVAETIRAVDYADLAGVTQPVTVRHARNRRPVRAERPSITIIMVGDEPRNDDLQRNTAETTRELSFDLQVDLDLPAETSELDPTGLEIASRILAAAAQALRAEDSPMLDLCDWVTPGSIDPEDEAQSDEGRLVRGMSVVYRVRADDANVLLSAEENA